MIITTPLLYRLLFPIWFGIRLPIWGLLLLKNFILLARLFHIVMLIIKSMVQVPIVNINLRVPGVLFLFPRKIQMVYFQTLRLFVSLLAIRL